MQYAFTPNMQNDRQVLISVLTPTIRPAGLEIVRKGLMAQTFQDFEWLVEIGYGNHDLNAAYNRMLRRAKGELVVSVQDFIKFPPDYLQKWWNAYQEYQDTFMTAPVGKVDNLEYSGAIRWDWRAYRMNDTDTVRECDWRCWEIDSGAAPLNILKEIGGFDEAIDGHWSSDNVNVGCRAHIAGYTFKCIFDNPCVAFDHDSVLPHPFRKDFETRLNNQRMTMFEGGMKLDPL